MVVFTSTRIISKSLSGMSLVLNFLLVTKVLDIYGQRIVPRSRLLGKGQSSRICRERSSSSSSRRKRNRKHTVPDKGKCYSQVSHPHSRHATPETEGTYGKLIHTQTLNCHEKSASLSQKRANCRQVFRSIQQGSSQHVSTQQTQQSLKIESFCGFDVGSFCEDEEPLLWLSSTVSWLRVAGVSSGLYCMSSTALGSSEITVGGVASSSAFKSFGGMLAELSSLKLSLVVSTLSLSLWSGWEEGVQLVALPAPSVRWSLLWISSDSFFASSFCILMAEYMLGSSPSYTGGQIFQGEKNQGKTAKTALQLSGKAGDR